MTAYITPTILTSKLFLGVVPSNQLGNVAWNDDGQCLFLTKRGATVMTPWLVSSMPAPPALVDPSMLPDKNSKEDDEDGDGDGEGSGAIGDKPEVTRPEGGDIKWWSNAIEVQPTGPRDQRYNWTGVTAGTSWLMRNEEVNPRQAIWSPSGLSDLGGCLLAILSSTGQLSVYAPRSDPIGLQWDEIADITYLTMSKLRPPIHRDEKPDSMQVREIQAHCIAWSPALPIDTYPGTDGSLLAVATRACGISLWAYGEEKRFRRVAHLEIGDKWATQLAWSEWVAIDDRASQARLAYVTPDGLVGCITVCRTYSIEGDKQTLDCAVEQPVCVDAADRRQITALQWIDNTLFWTKPGSAHFFSYQSGVTKNIRLERVGNWAGCNALGVCVGVHRISSTSIAIVLSTLTLHIVHNIHTNPGLAPLEESLVATLAARQAFLDHVHGEFSIRNRFHLGPIVPEQLTAWTSGWAGLGQAGIACFNYEVINFHNLDTSNEGKRFVVFGAIDITKSLPGPHMTAIEELRNLLDAPVNPLLRSASRELLPHVMRLVAGPPTPEEIRDLLDICAPDEEDPSASSLIQPGEDMRQAFFNREDLNASRLKYALALWCAGRYAASRVEFDTRATTSLRSTMAANLRVAVEHASIGAGTISSGSLDERYLRLLVTRAQRLKVSPGTISQRLPPLDSSLPADTASDTCRACQQPVDMGDILGIAKCSNGHHWSRCSITGFLITTPRYRTCTTCPAIALLPSRIETPHIAVDPSGQDRDHKRFTKAVVKGQELVQQVLESCSACIMCGGRWIRAT